MQKRATALTYKEYRTWFFGALSIFAVICSLYAYFVISSVVHVVMRKELNQEITATSSYISQLETQYINAQQAVNYDLAERDGYVAVRDKVFVDTSAVAVALSR